MNFINKLVNAITDSMHIPIGVCAGLAASMLYLHNLWAIVGFLLAAGGWWVAMTYQRLFRTSIKLHEAMSHDMRKLLEGLAEAGIEVTRVPVDEVPEGMERIHVQGGKLH